MFPGKSDSFLDVTRRPGVDADYWDAPLLTRNPKGCVEVAPMDCPVGKGVRLPVGEFCSTRLSRTPDPIVPASDGFGTVSCGGVVARGGWWYRVDEWLRDFGCERLEFGIRRPTIRSRCTAAVSGWLRKYRRRTEGDGQQRREEKHD